MKIYKTLLLITLFAILLPDAMAQDGENLSYDDLLNLSLDELMELDVVTTSKLSTENISEAPSVMSIITEDQIKKSGAKDMEEVLRTVAGFDITKKGMAPNLMVGVRGLYSTDGTNNKILFLINGHPYRSALYNDANVAIGNYPVKNISKIEVIRGPGSTLFGAGAFLAVINIITKDIEEAVEIQASTGSFNTYEGYGLGSWKGKKGHLKVSGDYFSTQGASIQLESDLASEMVAPISSMFGYPSVPSAVPNNLNYNRQTLNLGLEASFSNFYLLAGRMDSRDEPTIGIFEALTRENSVNNIGTFTELGYKLPLQDKGEVLIKSYYDLHQHDSDVESWAYETTEFFNYYTTIMHNMMQLPGNPTLYQSGEAQRYRTKSDNVNFGGEINFAYNIQNKFKILTGAMLERSLLNNISTSANGNFFLDSNMMIGTDFYIPLEAFGETKDISETFNWMTEADRTISAAFGQAEFNFSKAFDMGSIHNFALVVGARYDHYSDIGGSFNPRGALILAPSDKWYMKALYGEAFRAPSFAELYTQNHVVMQGNPDLKPEEVRTTEGVLGYKPYKGAEFTLSYFNTQVTDNIQPVYYQYEAQSFELLYENVGNYRSSGFELDFRTSINEKLSLSGSATYQEVLNITNDEKETVNTEGEFIQYQMGDFAPGGIPNYLFNLMANYEVVPFLNVNVGLNYVSERIRSEEVDFERDPVSWMATGNMIKLDERAPIPSRTLLNASLLFHNIPSVKNLEIQLSGNNLLNVDNYNPTTMITGADIQRAGINFLGTLRYKF